MNQRCGFCKRLVVYLHADVACDDCGCALQGVCEWCTVWGGCQTTRYQARIKQDHDNTKPLGDDVAEFNGVRVKTFVFSAYDRSQG